SAHKCNASSNNNANYKMSSDQPPVKLTKAARLLGVSQKKLGDFFDDQTDEEADAVANRDMAQQLAKRDGFAIQGHVRTESEKAAAKRHKARMDEIYGSADAEKALAKK